jgi:hypothetical protein
VPRIQSCWDSWVYTLVMSPCYICIKECIFFYKTVKLLHKSTFLNMAWPSWWTAHTQSNSFRPCCTHCDRSSYSVLDAASFLINERSHLSSLSWAIIVLE